MGLVNSIFLWGFLLLLIPIVVHLFEFRRIQKIDFSNVAFLQSILIQKVPKSRIKRVILLCSRLLFLLFFIAVFLKPNLFLNSIDGHNGSTLLVDNSLSLLDDCGSIDCISQVKKLVQLQAQAIERIGIRFNEDVDLKYYYGTEEISQVLDAIKANRVSFSNFSSDNNKANHLSILSDFKQVTLGVVDEMIRDSVAIDLLSLNHNFSSNVFVDTVFVNQLHSGSIIDIKVSINVKNSGTEDLEDVLVRLNGGVNQLGSSAFDINSGEVVELEFPIEKIGNTKFTIRIEDKRSAFDNDFYFTLPKSSELNVALISKKQNLHLEKLFANSNLFTLNHFYTSSINYEIVNSADLVIIDSFDILPDWLNLADLKGDVLFVPTNEISIDSYQRVIQRTLKTISDTSSFVLNNETLNNVFFNGIFENLESGITLPRVNVKYSISGVSDVLLKSKFPYLVRFNLMGGDNQVYFFTGNINSIQGHSIFLPLMYRIAEQTKGINEPVYYPLSDNGIVLRYEGLGNEVYRMVGSKSTFVPEVYFNNSDMVVSLPSEIITPGHYALMAGEDTLRIIGLNIPKSASIVDYHSADELRGIYDGNPLVRIVDTSSMGELESNLSNGDVGVPIWKYALLLALMFLIVETAIHRWVK